MKEVNKNSTQWLSQIILPMVIIFIIIGICGFLLFSGTQHGTLNLHILGDISAAFLLILLISSGLLILATMITFIYTINKSFNWLRIIFQNIQSIFLRIDPTVTKICKTTVHPFIVFESIHAIFENKNNPEG